MPTFETDTFLERYPEFKEVDYEKIDLFLSDAEMEVSQSRWGKLYQRGVLALTAHLLRLSLWTTEWRWGKSKSR